MLVTSRAGEMIWVSLAANDSNTSAEAIRLINRYSKIASLHYSVSENAIYVTVAGWANNICAHILSNVNGDYVPSITQASGLPSDATVIKITELGPSSEEINIGNSQKKIQISGSEDRPLYNTSSLALTSDIQPAIDNSIKTKANVADLNAHLGDKNNPHGVTATQVGALPTSGGTITGNLDINGKLTQGSPSEDSSISSMNRLESDLFIKGNGSAPNNPRVAGFYLGKSATDENRHLDIVSGDTYSYIDFNKATRESDFDARILVNVENGETQFTWGTDPNLTNKVFNVAGSLRQGGTPVSLNGHTHDDRYYTKSEISAEISTLSGAINSKATKATTLSGYGITDTYTKTQIDSALAGKQAAGSYAPASHTHDDRYYTESEIDSKVSTLNAAINGKAPSSHTHTISQVTNLQSTLDGKAPSSHTHDYIQNGTVGIKVSDSNEVSFSSNANYIYFGYDNRAGSSTLVNTYKFGTHSGAASAANGAIECGKITVSGAVKGGTVTVGNKATLQYDSTNECLNFVFE